MSVISQRSFTGGEQSPSLQARVDFSKYQTSLKTMRNFTALKHGGASNRPGTQFLGEAAGTRLIPFVAALGTAYALEFGSGTLRFYKNGAQLRKPGITVTRIFNGAGGVCNIGYAIFNILDHPQTEQEIYITGVSGALGDLLNNRTFKIISVNTGTSTLNIRYVYGPPVIIPIPTDVYLTASFEVIYEIVAPYSNNTIFDVQYAQSVDVMTLVHPDYPIKELRRNSDLNWEFLNYGSVLADGPSHVTAMTATYTASGSQTLHYAATVVYKSGESRVFDLAGNSGKLTLNNTIKPLSLTNFIQLNVTGTFPTGGIDSYNFYKKDDNGTYGLIGNSTSGTFKDINIEPDTNFRFPLEDVNFSTPGKYPSCVAYAQQRRLFANTDTEQESVWGSAVSSYSDFTIPYTTVASSPFLFKAAGKKFNPIKHILDLSKLVLLTESSEIVVNPDGSSVTPTNINLSTQTYNGSSRLNPIVINDNALYVQARGSIVRDLLFDFNIDGFTGNDISLFANHLFEGYTLVDWCYAQVPNSNVWAVRSDGVLLGLTYLREQQVLAWHRHDLEGGFVESVCSIPSKNEDDVYMIVRRTVQGREVRYVEKFASRFVNTNKEIKVVTLAGGGPIASTRNYNALSENAFMDSHLTYDGRNFNTQKIVKLETTTSGWTSEDTLEVSGDFRVTDIGNALFVYTADGGRHRFNITGFVPTNNGFGYALVQPIREVPLELRSTFTSHFAKGVDELGGLWHLEGKKVSVFADAFVVASPNNPSYETITVTGGKITLPGAYSLIHVGVPYVSDLETLAIDSSQAESMIDKKIIIQKISMNVEKTRGLWLGREQPTGNSVDGLIEMKQRNNEFYDNPISLTSNPESVIIDSNYSTQGRVFIRQIDPLPATILSIHPSGMMPFKGA